MPVRDICQTDAFVAAKLWSLCVHCCRKDSCPVPAQSAQAEELNGPFESKRTVVADCSDFLPTAEAGRLGIGKDGLRKPLAAAGVNDLCAECPSMKKDACGHHARYQLIDLSSIRAGRGIQAVTHCCSTVQDIVRVAVKGEKLHQIDEPQAP